MQKKILCRTCYDLKGTLETLTSILIFKMFQNAT